MSYPASCFLPARCPAMGRSFTARAAQSAAGAAGGGPGGSGALVYASQVQTPHARRYTQPPCCLLTVRLSCGLLPTKTLLHGSAVTTAQQIHPTALALPFVVFLLIWQLSFWLGEETGKRLHGNTAIGT